MRATLRSEDGSVNGWPWKWTAVGDDPRFIMRHKATGESMPADRSATTCPLVPTGSPPGPAKRWADT
jgi:hypothetical protein